MEFSNLRINKDRLWHRILESGKIGSCGNGGLNRPALSGADMAAREWFIRELEKTGLAVSVDTAFNVIGRLHCSRASRRVAIVGSHLDTVPNGGMFDGVLGVLAGLECLETIKENQIQLPWDLEVINFCDEEGAHKVGTMGSRAMAGTLGRENIGSPGEPGSFAHDLKTAGGNPDLIAIAKRNFADTAFFLELHIEQGPVLENKKKDIGVVTGIAGIRRLAITVKGRSDHAGTTPMNMREDAFMKSLPLIRQLPEMARKLNPTMVQTVGMLELFPGAVNVVPGECRFVVEVRSQKEIDLDRIEEEIRGNVNDDFLITRIYDKQPVELALPVMAGIERAAEKLGHTFTQLPSGAGHDAQTLAPLVPTGMIFIPCRDGSSHTPKEWATPEACAKGADTLLHTILELSGNQHI